MFLFLDQQDLIVDMSDHIIPTKRQSNGVIVACQEDDSDTIYACDSDMCYPVLFYHTQEVKDVPNSVISGYWYYRDGFFTTAKKMYEYRDRLLNECDKTFCNVEQWTKMEEAEQAIWTKYKQDLRDISLQPGFPYNIVFPIAPAKKFGGDHLTAIMADGTEISLISAEQNAIYIDGERCLTLELCTDAGTHQDQELRNIFLDPDKSKSITIEKEKYEGFTKLIRSVYEAGKITIIVAQKTNEASAELQEQVTAQQEAISILMGGTYNG